MHERSIQSALSVPTMCIFQVPTPDPRRNSHPAQPPPTHTCRKNRVSGRDQAARWLSAVFLIVSDDTGALWMSKKNNQTMFMQINLVCRIYLLDYLVLDAKEYIQNVTRTEQLN